MHEAIQLQIRRFDEADVDQVVAVRRGGKHLERELAARGLAGVHIES